MKEDNITLTKPDKDSCECMKAFNENGSLEELQSKILVNKNNPDALVGIACVYLKQGKPGLAFMCLVEALRLSPGEYSILEKAESLRQSGKPKYPWRLLENTCMVSIIMPTYKRGDSIKESILSVLNQTFEDFELIIVNDGGSDDVEQLSASFKSAKIRYIKQEKNNGLSSSLNLGILSARGKYIAFLDDDDIYYANHIESLVGTLEKKKDYGCAYSNSWRCYGEVKDNVFIENNRKVYELRPSYFDAELLHKNNYISTLNLMIRKNAFKKVGLFNEELTRMMDWDLLLRMTLHCKMLQVNIITGEYRWKSDNMSVTHKAEMNFLHYLIRNYYGLAHGKLALLKSYITNGQTQSAEKILTDLIDEYATYFKTTPLIKELICLIRKIYAGRYRKFINLLCKDYFKLDAKGSIAFISRNYSIIHLGAIIPLIPRKFLNSLKRHAHDFSQV